MHFTLIKNSILLLQLNSNSRICSSLEFTSPIFFSKVFLGVGNWVLELDYSYSKKGNNIYRVQPCLDLTSTSDDIDDKLWAFGLVLKRECYFVTTWHLVWWHCCVTIMHWGWLPEEVPWPFKGVDRLTEESCFMLPSLHPATLSCQRVDKLTTYRR